MKKSSALMVFLAVMLSLLVMLPICGCGNTAQDQAEKLLSQEVQDVLDSPLYAPVFTDPTVKLEETSSQDFTKLLYDAALKYQPLLGQHCTQVHMGYWSGPGNHGSLVRVLDAINAEKEPPQPAVWDEGATSENQYPPYARMLEEHWYERADPEDGKVTIYGEEYTDPCPVTIEQADHIWGQYSQRYTDIAELIDQATGHPVKVWCFVEGAKANRIFYKYELPELRKLEQKGAVQVYFAKNQDADWKNPDDWIEGTANAPEPVPAQ